MFMFNLRIVNIPKIIIIHLVNFQLKFQIEIKRIMSEVYIRDKLVYVHFKKIFIKNSLH